MVLVCDVMVLVCDVLVLLCDVSGPCLGFSNISNHWTMIIGILKHLRPLDHDWVSQTSPIF